MTLWIDQKYVSLVAPRLQQFKKKKADLYNFRCPFCGDSQKNKYKARGFLYQRGQAVFYKCHNCNISTTLAKLIEKIDPVLYREYLTERYRTGDESPAVEEETVTVGFKIEKAVVSLPGAVSLQKLPRDSVAWKYLLERKIPEDRIKELYFIDDMRKLVEVAPAYEGRLQEEARILIPFYSKKNGIFYGVSGRSLVSVGIRYMTVRFCDKPLIYGLNHIDETKTVYITEGPFDSMFLDNAIAAGGTSLMNAANMFKDTVLIFDNQPRNKEVVKEVERAAARGYKLMIWPSDWKYKDINEAIIDGISQSEIQELIYKNTHEGLSLNLAIRDWKRHA